MSQVQPPPAPLLSPSLLTKPNLPLRTPGRHAGRRHDHAAVGRGCSSRVGQVCVFVRACVRVGVRVCVCLRVFMRAYVCVVRACMCV